MQSNVSDRTTGTIRGGLQAVSCFQLMDSVEEVAEWLQLIGMEQYIPVFRSQSVTGDTLISLNSVELRKTLGVTKLKDRRIFLESIHYLSQALCMDTMTTIPEDGRILTHLSNERIFLTWVRFSVILHTVSIATVRLTNHSNEKNRNYITAIASVISTLATIALAYGTVRYYRMHRMIEDPGRDFLPDKVSVLVPFLFLFIGMVITLYALMSHRAEEAAILALLSL